MKLRIIFTFTCYSYICIKLQKQNTVLLWLWQQENKKLFSCSKQNEFTYFDEAVFKDKVNGNIEFIAALEGAIKRIHEHGVGEGRMLLEPQLFVGKHMANKINQHE